MFKKAPFPWTCPYCDRPTTVTSPVFFPETTRFGLEAANSRDVCVTIELIVCPNPECNRYTLEVAESDCIVDRNGNRGIGDVRQTWRLVPPSAAKPFPDYVPLAIRQDYTEACSIVGLSPKASATLSRRCLQGMIRNFWSVTGPTLKAEIDSIAERVEPLTWQAIDAVRSVGNIGAHMEKDIDLIIDVDANEASLLIWLIERLVADWYQARHERENMLSEIVALADDKKAQRER